MRIAIGVAYDGSEFEGWQSQPSGNTIQNHLERAIGGIAGAPVRATAAGRTDAGVHATGQVAHFDTEVSRPQSAWVRGVNASLPATIAVQWAAPVDPTFHARFSASARAYRYILYSHPVRPAVLARQVGWFHLPLELEPMRRAARRLVGRHDFSAFRAAECQAKSPVKTLSRADVARHGPYFVFDFEADAFLHHMVRNIVGCLVRVGKGSEPPDWVAAVLEARDRSAAAATFPATGLYLSRVEYPARFALPAFPPGLPELVSGGAV